MDFIQKLLIAVNDFKVCSPNRVGYLIFLAHRLSTELAIGVRHTDKLNCLSPNFKGEGRRAIKKKMEL